MTKQYKSHKNITERSWGFFGGKLEFDGHGYSITLNNGIGDIYLEANEARSLVSLFWKILFYNKKKSK